MADSNLNSSIEGAVLPVPAKTNVDTPAGFAFALGAYLCWGVLPYYMKAVGHIPPIEVVAHRIIWSIPVGAGILLYQGRTQDLRAAIRNPRMLGMAAVTAMFVSVNWLIYVYAIGAGRTVDAALGYYINPLFSVFMARVMLGERLNRAQLVAIALAIIAVGILTWDAGGLPWISIGLAVSWGFYAYFKKALPIGPNQGFLLEVLILLVPALIYVGYIQFTGTGHYFEAGTWNTALLSCAGFVTAVPLMLYANGAKLLRLSTIGVMQYLTPTLVFLTAIFAFHEPFGLNKLIAFCFIWAALIVYTASAIQSARSKGL